MYLLAYLVYPETLSLHISAKIEQKMEKDDERKLKQEERRNGGIKEKQENRANVQGCAQTKESILISIS